MYELHKHLISCSDDYFLASFRHLQIPSIDLLNSPTERTQSEDTDHLFFSHCHVHQDYIQSYAKNFDDRHKSINDSFHDMQGIRIYAILLS